MRTIRLYCPALTTGEAEIALPEAAHRHAVQVLRLKQGDPLRLFDGSGLEYEATLLEVSRRHSWVKLGARVAVDNESPLQLTLLQGISRGERMDFALQKAVELGVNRIIPVLTARCNVSLSVQRAEKRQQHWQGVMISACEQSGRARLPQLLNVMSLADAVTMLGVSCAIVLDPMATAVLKTITPQQEMAILIGPEGGLTTQEIQMATQAGFHAVRFGPRILRTETAAIAALAAIQALWGDMG